MSLTLSHMWSSGCRPGLCTHVVWFSAVKRGNKKLYKQYPLISAKLPSTFGPNGWWATSLSFTGIVTWSCGVQTALLGWVSPVLRTWCNPLEMLQWLTCGREVQLCTLCRCPSAQPDQTYILYQIEWEGHRGGGRRLAWATWCWCQRKAYLLLQVWWKCIIGTDQEVF